MGGRIGIINVARERNRFSLNESIQEEMEESYLEMGGRK